MLAVPPPPAADIVSVPVEVLPTGFAPTITTEEHKVLLHLAVGNKESERCWREFMRDMVMNAIEGGLLGESHSDAPEDDLPAGSAGKGKKEALRAVRGWLELWVIL